MNSNIREITKLVPFTIADSIVGMSTKTFSIDIDRSDWELALVTIWNQTVGVSTSAIRLSGFLVLRTDKTKAYSQVSYKYSDTVGSYTGPYYTITQHKYRGFSYAVDSRLSDACFDVSGYYVQIDEAKINGSDVDFIFRNTWGWTKTIKVRGIIKLYRTVPL